MNSDTVINSLQMVACFQERRKYFSVNFYTSLNRGFKVINNSVKGLGLCLGVRFLVDEEWGWSWFWKGDYIGCGIFVFVLVILFLFLDFLALGRAVQGPKSCLNSEWL